LRGPGAPPCSRISSARWVCTTRSKRAVHCQKFNAALRLSSQQMWSDIPD
jgi:hypothetical protein